MAGVCEVSPPTTPSSLRAQRASQHCRIPWPSVAKGTGLSAKASDHARRFKFFRRKTNASVHCWQMLASGLSCSHACFSTCWRLLLSVSASFWRAWLARRAFTASPSCCCTAQKASLTASSAHCAHVHFDLALLHSAQCSVLSAGSLRISAQCSAAPGGSPQGDAFVLLQILKEAVSSVEGDPCVAGRFGAHTPRIEPTFFHSHCSFKVANYNSHL